MVVDLISYQKARNNSTENLSNNTHYDYLVFPGLLCNLLTMIKEKIKMLFRQFCIKKLLSKGTSLWATAAKWGNILRYFLSVFGLVLIIEGLPYFAFPDKFKKMISKLPGVSDNVLRLFGFIAMVTGLVFIYISRAGE